MDVDEMILINQLAQGIIDIREGEKWFMALNIEAKREALYTVNAMIGQASPRPEDIAPAIILSGLKPTFTPCVLLSKPNLKIQLPKIPGLREEELLKAFKLLTALLSVADRRRREEKPLDTVNHWWHRDLRDPEIIADIRQRYYAGKL